MWKHLVATIILASAGATPAFAQLNWTKASPGGGGSFRAVALAADGTVLVGSDLSGAYRRVGTGDWTRLGRRDGIDATQVDVVSWQPGQSLIALAGTRNGLYRSADGGVTWVTVGPPASQDFSAIGWGAGGVVYAASATGSGSGDVVLRKSTDGGQSWSLIVEDPPLVNHRAVKLVVDPNDNQTVWLLSGHDGNFGGRKELYKTIDGGASWGLKSGSFNAIDVALHPTTAGVVLMTTSTTGPTGGDDDMGSVQRSVTGGDAWGPVTLPGTTDATGAVWFDGADAYLINVQADACPSHNPPFLPPARSGKFRGTSTDGWQTSTWTKVDDGVGGVAGTSPWELARIIHERQ